MNSFYLESVKVSSDPTRAGGGIGRRARFRTVWGNPWRFESSLAHNLLVS